MLSDRYKKEALSAIETFLPEYRFDQYRYLPSQKSNTWQRYLMKRLNAEMNDESNQFFFDISHTSPLLLGCKKSKWDEDHFGIKMAFINWLIAAETSKSREGMSKILDDCISSLKKEGFRYVSARINSDDIASIHLLEDKGFRYYETILYPIVKCVGLSLEPDPSVRLINPSAVDDVLRIAEQHQFQRGHFYCDERFDKNKVNSMYVKWIRTTLKNNEPIAIFMNENSVLGYFTFVMEDELSNFFGHSFGRMTSLAMDISDRGKGFGSRFFRGLIALIAGMGKEYILSEYATKNHISARLHAQNSFYSIHDKVLFHLWL